MERWRNITLCMGLFVAQASCVLLELDELDLKTCQRDRDCFALALAGGGGPTACYRCSDRGVCEARGSVAPAQTVALDAPLQEVEAATGPLQPWLVWGTDGARSTDLRGVALDDDTSTPVALDPPLQQVAAAPLGGARLVVAGVRTRSCGSGLLMAGFGTLEGEALALEPVRACSLDDPSVHGTRFVAVSAERCGQGCDRPIRALVAWLDAPMEACRLKNASCPTYASLQVATLSLVSGSSPSDTEITEVSDAARSDVAPKVAGVGSGFWLAYATENELVVRAVGGATTAEWSVQADAAELSLTPDTNNEGALLAYRTRGRSDLVLVQLQEAQDGRIRALGDPRELATQSAPTWGPRALYVPRGAGEGEPSGSWVVTWSAAAPGGTRPWAALVPVSTTDDWRPGRASPIAAGGSHPFSFPDSGPPFSFGLLQLGDAEASRTRIETLRCPASQ